MPKSNFSKTPHGGKKQRWSVKKRKTETLIEESAAPFIAHSVNMLPEDHPAYNHVNRLLQVSYSMADDLNAFKFTTSITMDAINAVQRNNGYLSDTLDEMKAIMSSLSEV
jgi:hypothetical protein